MTRRNDPNAPPPTEAELDAYIARRCEKTVGGCVEWNGAMSGGGPHFKTARPHSIVISVRRYKAAKRGPLPNPRKMKVTTTCGNPRCVSDAHITVAGTSSIIKAAAQRKPDAWRTPARIVKLQAHGRRMHSKLTVDDVAAIRAADGTTAAIGARFGICADAVSAIRSHKRWRDVGGNPWAGLMRGVA